MPTEGAPSPGLEKLIAGVQLVGRSAGRVKQLGAFDKSRHVVPDAVNAATTAFLARLCAEDLRDEAEDLFQRARVALKYRRKDLSLDVTPPLAVLRAKHFTYELAYALMERTPEQFAVTRTLHQLTNPEVVGWPEFDELFARQFAEIGFLLKKGVQVEAVIDAVEALDDETSLRVDYPSDCSSCTLQVQGVEATVVCDGASLAMQFPRPGSPRELLEAFEAVRATFTLSRQTTLAALLS
ncbi:MAG TPA: hypothetical protein VHF69_14550 [Candidatus Synoicihabitans sp.]|nr:hypothetical protein [Candidatus Synoicihabitans sp.]